MANLQLVSPGAYLDNAVMLWPGCLFMALIGGPCLSTTYGTPTLLLYHGKLDIAPLRLRVKLSFHACRGSLCHDKASGVKKL